MISDSRQTTYKLAILSRDARCFADLIEQAELPFLEIVLITEKATDFATATSPDIVLADPNLLALCQSIPSSVTWVQSTWAGVSPLIGRAEQHYTLTGLKDVFAAQMREYVMAYLLHFSRAIETFSTRQIQHLWQLPKIQPLAGKTLGIMGVGSIGKEIAKIAKQFEMNVLGLVRTTQTNTYIDQYYLTEQSIAFAKQCDFVVSILPDTPLTKHLINSDFLDAVPDHAVIINVGRSQVIDTQSLIHALKNNTIKAAVLDVFDQEPLPPEDPLWDTPHLYITQHSAGISSPKDVTQIFLENVVRYQSNSPLNFVVNMQLGY